MIAGGNHTTIQCGLVRNDKVAFSWLPLTFYNNLNRSTGREALRMYDDKPEFVMHWLRAHARQTTIYRSYIHRKKDTGRRRAVTIRTALRAYCQRPLAAKQQYIVG